MITKGEMWRGSNRSSSPNLSLEMTIKDCESRFIHSTFAKC